MQELTAGYYFNPWWREHDCFVSQIGPDQCREIVVSRTTRFLGRSIGRAWTSPADFTLHRTSMWSRNSFKPFAYVWIKPHGSGSAVRVKFASPYLVQAFLGFWFGFLGLWTGLVLLGTAGRGHIADAVMPLIFAVGMGAFGFLLSAGGRAIARGDRDFIVDFLRENLQVT